MQIIEYIKPLLNLIKEAFSGLISRFFIALIILLIGLILGNITSRVTSKALKRMQLNRRIKEISGITASVEEIITHFIKYFIYFIGIVMGLKQLGIATDILNILSGVIIILIGIFIILSVKDFIPSIISGIILSQKGYIKQGDTIEVNNTKGKVIKMTLLDTRLKTKSGDQIIIPNSTLTKNQIIKKK